MCKRSQITIYLILGLLIVIGIIIMLYSRTNMPPIGEAFQSAFQGSTLNDPKEVEIYITACLQNSFSDVMASIGSTDPIKLNCTLPDSSDTIISYGDKESLKSFLKHKIENNFTKCINSFSAFESKNYDIDIESGPFFYVTLNEKDITVRLEYLISVSIGNSRKKTEDFVISFPCNPIP